ncbi:plasmid partitioning protein RepA (plasmid) [Microvirga terrae]|uniref:Plasmid partitioning protein RepA n=1 Tax=Microvirga terrae TaxID=2740529 RepID=A0ABY5RYS4_9HYPH|nr:plasmid partitioning protein RepA [Microvirga terrae]UVF22406.1 plasmid partitioning protein RepA [Microvirga terrae]
MAVPQLKVDAPRVEALASPPAPKVDDAYIDMHAKALSEALHQQRLALYPPVAQKTLRKFTSGEVAKLIGVDDGYLRQLALEEKGPLPETLPNGRRMYSLEEINALRTYLDQNARAGRRYLKHRSETERLQVISCVNFKGGSAKTTSAAHLAQYLALNGYRVLAIDLDPQASLSALHGYQPEFDVQPNETIYGSIRYDDEARHPSEIIRRTYIPGLDIIPGNLELMEFEHETPMALTKRRPGETKFFSRLTMALDEVADNYDVVVIDCPPQLGFLTLAALSASSSLLVTVHPQMLDVMSMSQFLTMTADLLRVVKGFGGTVEYDWMRYLVTRYEPGDGPQSGMVEYLRSLFPDSVLENPMLKSTAIADAGINKQTIYEVSRDQFTKSTYDRAIDAMNKVNAEIESLIKKTWGRA